MNEQWRAIAGWESLYQVSDQGRVRVIDRAWVDALGRLGRRAGRIMTPRRDRLGYLSVTLRAGARSKRWLVHRLVAHAFVAVDESRVEVNHRNGIKSDNRAVNLEWVTKSENMKHAAAIGLIRLPAQRGASNGFAKLTDADVRSIRERRRAGESLVSIAKDFPVSPSRLGAIASGGGWAHILEHIG